MLPFFNLLAALWVASAMLPVQTDADEILAQLSELRLDKNQIYRVRDVTIRRDVLSVAFERGVIAFLEPVAGQVTGAVFVGSGDVLTIPPDDVERRQLNRFTGSPILNETFDAAMLRFTDDTYQEILDALRDRASEDVRADDLESILPLERNIGEISAPHNFRILGDLVEGRERPYFFGSFNRTGRGWFDAVYDVQSFEEVLISAAVDGVPEIWASFNRRSESRDPEGAASNWEPAFDIQAYDIDTTLDPDGFAAVRVRMRLEILGDGAGVVRFDLDRGLRVDQARIDGVPVSFYQSRPPTEPGDGAGSLLLVLADPAASGDTIEVDVRYQGGVLPRAGERLFVVPESLRWYPRTPHPDPAEFAMTFHFPAGGTLVASGDFDEEVRTEGTLHSRWHSGRDVFSAGFSFGDFSTAVDPIGVTPVYLHVNNDLDSLFSQFAGAQAESDPGAVRRFLSLGTRDADPTVEAGLEPVVYARRAVAERMQQASRRVMEFYRDTLGPYRFARLDLLQVPLAATLGWPGLAHLAIVEYLEPGERAVLGIAGTGATRAEWYTAERLSKQWFGNAVRPRTYRDQWLFEGLARHAALMYIGEAEGAERAAAILESDRDRLMTPVNLDGSSRESEGPVWLGPRLIRANGVDIYYETVPTKSAWILHMLRRLMADPASDRAPGDEPFSRMVRDFLDTYDGQAVTFWDFKAVAERHMGDRLDVNGDGTLDWFFDQWVLGAGVPGYSLDYAVREEGSGYIVTGRIDVEGGSGFVMPVPVHATTVDGNSVFLGDVLVRDESAELFFGMDERPEQIVLDPNRSILRR